MLPAVAVAAAGAAGAIAVATLLSPLAPMGEARLAEPAPGLSFDAAVIGLGALATVAVVLVLGVLPALRGARVRGAAGRVPAVRPSAVAGAAAAAGAPPGAVIGIRHALERGRGTRAIPVRTALIGSVAAVAAVCATAVFGTSLAHLTATPALYGAPFQAYFNSSGPGGSRRGQPAHRAEARPGDRPDHPGVGAGDRRQPRQRPGHRRDRRSGPNAAVGRAGTAASCR